MKIPINWACFPGSSGYAQAAQDMILALHESGEYDIRVEYLMTSKGLKTGISEDRYRLFQDFVQKPKDMNRIQVFHCIPPHQWQSRKTNRNLGYATFETFNPPNSGNKNWISILNSDDAIIAPSQFNYRIFAHERIEKPIFYVPHCYNTKIWNDDVSPFPKNNKFTFMFLGTWHLRKGWPQLLEAWFNEFSEKDNVRLVIKTDKKQKAIIDIDKLKKELGFNKVNKAEIFIESRIMDEEDLPRFMKSADCYISPHMGEGFGLPGLQFMALGIPVIITNFSGSQDYASEKTATLIEPSGFRQIDMLDGRQQFLKKKWAFLSINSIRSSMRYVLNNKSEVLEKSNNAKKFVYDNFNYKVVADKFGKMIQEIYNV